MNHSFLLFATRSSSRFSTPVVTPILVLMLTLILIASGTVPLANAAEYEDGVTHLSQSEFLQKKGQADTVVIDIRKPYEIRNGFIPGATQIEFEQLLANPSLLDEYQDKDLVFYCHSGGRVRKLTEYLQNINHDSVERLFHLKGDMRAWRARQHPIAFPDAK